MATMKLLLPVGLLILYHLPTNLAEVNSLPDDYAAAYTTAGFRVLRAEISTMTARVRAAYGVYTPAKTACIKKATLASKTCAKCVGDKCRERARKVCRPTLPSTAPSCNDLKTNASYTCLYYARISKCSACSDLRSEACKSCVKTQCTTRYQSVCPPTRPTVEPDCGQLKSDSSFYCLYYVDRSICSTCTSATPACRHCVKTKCQERYTAICPPTRPTVEPSCLQLQSNTSFYCRYYLDKSQCSDCPQNLQDCKACIKTKCTARYISSCRPTTIPSCPQLSSNSSHYCLYYTKPSECSSCTDVKASTCKSCVKSKCKSRARDVCGNVITDAIFFFKEDVPTFFLNTLPDTFKNIGNDIGNFGGVILRGLGDFSDIAGNIGADVGRGFENLGNAVVSGVLNPVGQGFDHFFTDLVPNIVGDIQSGFTNVIGHLTPDFGGIGQDLSRLGNLAIHKVLDAAESGITDIGKIVKNKLLDPVVGGFKDLRTKIGGDILGSIGDGIGEIGKGLGDLGRGLRDIFGGKRKKRSLGSLEPTCSEIKANPNQVCLYYKNTAKCPNCGFTPSRDCAGWTSAVNNLRSALAARKWVSSATNKIFKVKSVKYDTAKKGAGQYSFRDIEVGVHLLGSNYQFTLTQMFNLRNATQVGSAIAREAVVRARRRYQA